MLESIKLIIWDLDETLWEGVLSEGEVRLVEKRVNFIIESTNCGIIHSICSKNDYTDVKKKLHESGGLWDYFVFPSVNWMPKGARVKQLIKDMKLRSENVLFIDDNETNLEEVKFYSSEIHIMKPEEMDVIIEEEKEQLNECDREHRRLAEYKLLERKQEDQKASSNEQFLLASNIMVSCKEDCANHLERICELVKRTNQLNYTKKRVDSNEIKALIEDEKCKTGYVNVKDKYGNYGIVGFYAIRDGRALHFLFSCRCLGMGVEQYVYSKLGYPEIEVVDEVAVELIKDMCPEWVSEMSDEGIEEEDNNTDTSFSILFKGPCDLSQLLPFLKNQQRIDVEFSYVNDKGVLIEGHNHTAQIVTAMKISKERRKELASEFPFWDEDMFRTSLGGAYDFVVLSMLAESNLGVYRRKGRNEYIAVCEDYYNITDARWNTDYISGNIFTSNIPFSKQMLDLFAEKYEYVDYKIEDTIRNLTYIREHINSKLILMLGAEREFVGGNKPSYENRHLRHKELNHAIREWATAFSNVILISYDDYMTGTQDFTDTINHFTKIVYWRVGQELVKEFNKHGADVHMKGRWSIAKENLKVWLHKFPLIVKVYHYLKYIES